MSFTETSYSAAEQEQLLDTARVSIRHGLDNGAPLKPDVSTCAEALQAVRATFVTLEIKQRLRGCIGTLEAAKPLIEDVANNAFEAAFHDPRFAPLGWHEFDALDIHISILTLPEPMSFTDEEDLLRQLEPGRDGLIFGEGTFNRATFLPSVWKQLPNPRQFLAQLKRKAGLAPDYWSPKISAQRYQTMYIPKT